MTPSPAAIEAARQEVGNLHATTEARGVYVQEAIDEAVRISEAARRSAHDWYGSDKHMEDALAYHIQAAIDAATKPLVEALNDLCDQLDWIEKSEGIAMRIRVKRARARQVLTAHRDRTTAPAASSTSPS